MPNLQIGRITNLGTRPCTAAEMNAIIVRTVPAPQPPALIEWRCSKCKKLLGRFVDGLVGEIVCPRCDTLNKRTAEQ